MCKYFQYLLHFEFQVIKQNANLGTDMNTEDIFPMIKYLQKELRQGDNEKLSSELKCYVNSQPWCSQLIYGSMYIKQTQTSNTSEYFAIKTLETIEAMCEGRINNEESTCIKNQDVNINKAIESSRKQRDQLLISLAFLSLAFVSKKLRIKIQDIEKDISKKITRYRESFIDEVPLKDYLMILDKHLRKSEAALMPLRRFFDALIRDAISEKNHCFQDRTAMLKNYSELLFKEAGRRIEKPDRIFSCADTLDLIAEYTEMIFNVGEDSGKKFLKKYNWAYPRGQSFEDLNAFWTACMIGLFAFSQALDESNNFNSESDQAEIKASTKNRDELDNVINGKNAFLIGGIRSIKNKFMRIMDLSKRECHAFPI